MPSSHEFEHQQRAAMLHSPWHSDPPPTSRCAGPPATAPRRFGTHPVSKEVVAVGFKQRPHELILVNQVVFVQLVAQLRVKLGQGLHLLQGDCARQQSRAGRAWDTTTPELRTFQASHPGISSQYVSLARVTGLSGSEVSGASVKGSGAGATAAVLPICLLLPQPISVRNYCYRAAAIREAPAVASRRQSCGGNCGTSWPALMAANNCLPKRLLGGGRRRRGRGLGGGANLECRHQSTTDLVREV